MKKIIIVLLCLVSVISLMGCANDPLIGTWYYSDDITAVMEAVNSDPTKIPSYAFEIKSSGKSVGNPEGGSAVLTYKIDGNQVTFFDQDGNAQQVLKIDGKNLTLEDGAIIYTKK